MIFDVDSGGKGALAAPLQDDDVNRLFLCARRQDLTELMKQGDIEHIERRAVYGDHDRPISFFREYSHLTYCPSVLFAQQ